ncbi:hypothetical protein MiAbW_01712 [Microcystis aeruginosa NIES-4325]|uniref:Uncharacterized protein n=1 Tax=Microcystis aeruginosa NIES-4325 TaxID=2569534 RepID=A0A5J4F770_MICAE|nr:hypothetical protein MiAbW_01712 [Microcystis aeruginosa NIES-4325]
MSIDLVFTEKPEEPSHHQAKGLKTDFLPTSTIKLLPKLPIKLSNLSPLCQGDVGIVNICSQIWENCYNLSKFTEIIMETLKIF